MASSPKELPVEEKAARRDEIADLVAADAPDDANKAVQFDQIVDVVNRDTGEEAEPDNAPAAPAADDASAIAASAEAKTHPQLALKAIGGQMSLAQFRAMAATVPPEAKGASFEQKMADAPRIPPDAKAGAKSEDNVIPAESMAERRKKASGRA